MLVSSSFGKGEASACLIMLRTKQGTCSHSPGTIFIIDLLWHGQKSKLWPPHPEANVKLY